ncbi:MAG: tRNA pseudouridine synthase A [Zestosphaera sp.]
MLGLSSGIEFIKKLDDFAGVNRQYVLVREFRTDESFGKIPEQRSLDEKLRFGVINLDKPPGPTSHEVAAWVKELLGLDKVGHGGTLESLNL